MIQKKNGQIENESKAKILTIKIVNVCTIVKVIHRPKNVLVREIEDFFSFNWDPF